jgi:hypothetical protein
VAQLAEALCYKPEGRGFDSRMDHSTSFRTMASNRCECQGYILRGKGDQCVGLTTLPASCADLLEILGAQTT